MISGHKARVVVAFVIGAIFIVDLAMLFFSENMWDVVLVDLPSPKDYAFRQCPDEVCSLFLLLLLSLVLSVSPTLHYLTLEIAMESLP